MRIANFKARARRSEYWASLTIALVAALVAGYIDAAISSGSGFPALIAIGSMMWPFWGAAVNRLHDIGRR